VVDAIAAGRLITDESRPQGGGLYFIRTLPVVAAPHEGVQRRKFSNELFDQVAQFGPVGYPIDQGLVFLSRAGQSRLCILRS